MGPILARYFSGRILSWSVWSILIIPSGSSMLIRVPVRSRSSPKITLTCKTEGKCHCVNWAQAKKMEPRLLGKITTEKMFYSTRHAESLKRKRAYRSSLKYYLGGCGHTMRAEHPFVFFLIEEEKRRLCLNHVKPLTSPQPGLLD